MVQVTKGSTLLALILIASIFLMASQLQTNDLLASKARGKEVYSEVCMTCHLANGKGTPGAFPPLANSDYLLKSRKEIIHTVKYGLSGPITVNGQKYDNVMPSPGLSDKEIADVLNYISNSWGNTKDFVSEGMVKEVKE